MRKNSQKSFRLCFFAIILGILMTGIFSAAIAFADPVIPKKRVIYMGDAMQSSNIELTDVSDISAITKLKSSKKSVATVSKFGFNGVSYVSIAPKKAGTTTVSFNVKYQDKTIKAKIKVVVKKYVNPLKSFKIGSKDYTSKFNETAHLTFSKALKGKLNVKLKSGYKIYKMSVFNWIDGGISKDVKNKKSVKVSKGSTLSLQIIPKGASPDEGKIVLEIMAE